MRQCPGCNTRYETLEKCECGRYTELETEPADAPPAIEAILDDFVITIKVNGWVVAKAVIDTTGKQVWVEINPTKPSWRAVALRSKLGDPLWAKVEGKPDFSR